MKHLKTSIALLSVLALAVAAVASGALNRPAADGRGAMAGMSMTMSHSSGAAASKAVQLRIMLNELLGEHAILAIQATQRGLVGGKDFPAVAKQYGKTFSLVHGAYEHMFMTGEVLAGGIAKQKGLK